MNGIATGLEPTDAGSEITLVVGNGHRATRGERWEAEAEEGCNCQWCEAIHKAEKAADRLQEGKVSRRIRGREGVGPKDEAPPEEIADA